MRVFAILEQNYSLLLHHSNKLRWIPLVAFKQSAILCTMEIAMERFIADQLSLY